MEAANRRLRLVREKVEAVRRWGLAIDRAVNECRGELTRFSGSIQLDLPKAIAALDRMSESLETYVATGVPAELAAPPAEKSADAARETAGGPDA